MVVALLAARSFAQDVVLEDFTGPTASWFVSEGVGLFVDPPVPWDGQALQCTPNAGGTQCVVFTSTRFPITHDTVRVQAFTDDPAGGVTTATLVSDFGGPEVSDLVAPVAAGSWNALDLDASAGCGEWYRLEYDHESSGATYIDDVVSTGEICPQLVDLDADGLCPRGNDFDGDGTCVDSGEPAEPGVTVECNETVPGARCLVLTQDPLVVGVKSTFSIDGAIEGEQVLVVWGPRPGISCPPSLGVTCLDVDQAIVIRRATADVNGHAEFELKVPVAAAGLTLYTQAAAIRFASPSDVSEVLVTQVP